MSKFAVALILAYFVLVPSSTPAPHPRGGPIECTPMHEPAPLRPWVPFARYVGPT